jgi:hypothetical protein
MDVIKEENNEGLLDTIHKCIMCGAPAYEVAENEYACTKCECTWKVDNCE